MLDDIRAKAGATARTRIIRNATVYERYTVERGVLGNGLSGAVRTVTNKQSGKQSAMKSLKMKNMSAKRWEMLYNEVDIYLKLDHPYICRLQEVYEDQDAVHLIMELCSGRELYERLANKRAYSEKDAILAVQSMLQAIQYMHKNKYAHRDLKLENWVYQDETEEAQLKLIDFGFSQVWSAATPMTAVHGTVYYVAPEVLAGSYNHLCDIWSTGVITYMLLSGAPPFNGPNDPAIVQRIKKMKFDFNSRRFNGVSDEAKSFIEYMLVPQKDRPDATACLQHRWITSVQKEYPPLEADTLVAITEFNKASNLTKAALSVVACTLNSSGIRNLEEQFQKLDKQGDGFIHIDDLKVVMKKEIGLSNTEIKKLFANSKNVEKISYNDFIAAATQSKFAMDDALLKEAFDKFDASHKGYITVENLKDVVGASFNGEKVEDIMKRCDKSGKGRIDFSHFKEVIVHDHEDA